MGRWHDGAQRAATRTVAGDAIGAVTAHLRLKFTARWVARCKVRDRHVGRGPRGRGPSGERPKWERAKWDRAKWERAKCERAKCERAKWERAKWEPG